MSNELFVAVAAVFFVVLFRWGFRVLPGERWQFLTSVPHRRFEDGSWQAINLTFYGLFNALAHAVSLSLLLILTGAVGISIDKILGVLLTLMCVCIPSSRLLARLIEKKSHTFTVGGASFVGILLAPASVWFVYSTIYPGSVIPFLPILAAMAIAFAAGEGVGRLACISFGCCYGKPINSCGPLLQQLFCRRAFVFTGTTKKIAYEGGLDNQKVFPIQAVTSTILIGTALTGIYLFLNGSYGLAFVLTIVISQGWRLLSETLRADYRGSSAFSVYQIFAILAVIYALILWTFFPAATAVADIQSGVRSLWQPGVILFLQVWGAGIFWYTGRSYVTGAHIVFHINKEHI
jgi:hypothetical protein